MELEYASRFHAPFHDEPFWSALRELLGAMFFVKHPIGCGMDAQDIFAWQSPTIRWRHFYHTTFDLSFLVVVLVCWGLALWCCAVGKRRAQSSLQVPELIFSAVWSFLSVIPLAGFYLHFHSISSRYVRDFMPAIAVAMFGSLTGVRYLQLGSWRNLRVLGILLLFVAWWGWQFTVAKTTPGESPVARAELLELLGQLQFKSPTSPTLPTDYASGSKLVEKYGIPWNGNGWLLDGSTAPVVTLFVKDPNKLALEIVPAPGVAVTERDYSFLKVKVGLELLQLESMNETNRGKRLVFRSPTRKAYRKGIQVVFVSFVSPENMMREHSPFLLLKISWRENRELK